MSSFYTQRSFAFSNIGRMVKLGVLALVLTAASTFQAQSQVWTSVATDTVGDTIAGLPDGTGFFYRYDWQVDSVFFRITVDDLNPHYDTFGTHVAINVPNVLPVNSWGTFQGGGTQNTTFDYNRLITTWVTGTLPSNYSGTIGTTDAPGVTANNFVNLSANSITITADTVNDEVILGLQRFNFISNGELGDTVRTVPLSASVGDSAVWGDDIFTGVGSIDIVPAPDLLVPANNTLDLPLNGVQLEWDSIIGATQYVYQYALNPGFTNGLVTNTSTTPNAVINGLNFYTTYYWRVQAISGTDTSRYSPFFAFNTELEIPQQTMPPDSSTSHPVNGLILEWDSIFGAIEYVVEYSKDSTFMTNVFTASSTDTNATINGLEGWCWYFWRVASSDGTDTSDFSGHWAFRTVPAAPTLLDPGNNDEGISVLGDSLRWSSSAGATEYHYEYATSPFFFIPLESIYQTDTGTTMNVQKNHNTLHYWRVRALNTTDTSEWSVTWQFRTTLDTVDLVAPFNGNIIPTVDTTLVWDILNTASNYRVQYSTDLTFNTNVVTNVVSGTQLNLFGLMNSTDYYWRVQGLDNPNNGEWSDIWSFQTGIAVPFLLTPANNAIDLDVQNTVISWTSVAGANEYVYQYSLDSNFITGVFTDSTTATTQQLPLLGHNRLYFWRVQAKDGTSRSPWSAAWNFRTINLSVPVHLTPATGTTDLDMNTVTTTWTDVFGATGYVVNYGRDQTFLNEVNVEVVPNTTVTITDLFGDTKYFWRVRATDGVTFSDWTLPWNFDTNLDPPFLISPDSNSFDVGVNDLSNGTFSVLLDWTTVKGAEKYQMQVWETPDPDTTFLYDNEVFSSNFNISGLEDSTLYYWRVRSLGPFLTSPWSQTWLFTTGVNITSVLSVPADLKQFKVFPNPSNGLYNVAFEGSLSNNAVLEVYNNLGQQVLTERFVAGQTTVIDIQDWEAGMYQLKIQDGDQVYHTPVIKH